MSSPYLSFDAHQDAWRRVDLGRLVEVLAAPEKKQAVVRDAARMIDEEVGSKGGIGGLALKGAYKIVTSARHDFVANSLEKLMPSFASRLEPIYDERQAAAPQQPLEVYFTQRASDVANALLSITDERAQRSQRGGARAAYEKLRPSAHRHVEEAAPKIGRLLDRHLS